MSGSEAIVFALVLVIAIAVYFVPFAIAAFRGHRYKAVIFALNLIGGWSGLGWIAALVWAVWPSGSTVSDVVTHDPTGLSSRNVGTAAGEVMNEVDRTRVTKASTAEAAQPEAARKPGHAQSAVSFEVRTRDGVRRFRADSLPCVIGSGPDADVRIRHGSIADAHALVRIAEGGIVLSAMSTDAQLNVGGAMVRRANVPFDGTFRLGEVPLTVRAVDIVPAEVELGG